MTAADTWDPHIALGLRFDDANLARCVRETAKMRPDTVDTLRCFQAEI